MAKVPLIFTYYIAAPVEKVWDGFVSKEANHKIFLGAEFEVDLKPGGATNDIRVQVRHGQRGGDV